MDEQTDDQWRETLTGDQYAVLRCSATEPPFTGAFWDHHEPGVYTCAGCGAELFRSEEKFDSGTGWPSFWDAVDPSRVARREDLSHGMRRIEVLCAACGGHLGHLFPDGPPPTGARYCINSAALAFRPGDAEEDEAA